MFHNLKKCALAICCCLAILNSSTLAQDLRKSFGAVALKVRVIKAKNSQVSAAKRVRRHFTKDLSDLKSQLTKLHYRDFTLVSGVYRDVDYNKGVKIDLIDGHTLDVKPLYQSNNRICLLLKWLDGSQMKVLDTRVHLDIGKPMITGTDMRDENSGLILAIDVRPAAGRN